MQAVAGEDGAISDAAVRKALSSAGPEAVLLWLPPAAAGRLARSLRTAGFKGPIAGPSRLASGAFAAEAGPFADGVVVPGIDPEAGSGSFGSRYRRLFGTDPDPAAALAHDAVLLLVRAVRRSESSVSTASFVTGEPLRGATGLLVFDRHGDRLVQLPLWRYRSGHLARL